MAPERTNPPVRSILLGLCLALAIATPAHALRVVNWNLTNYPNVLLAQRQPYMRTVLAPLHPDVMVCQEVTSQAGVDSFVTNVLNVVEPGQWVAAPFYNGNDTDNALFYKPSKVQLLGSWAFYPNPANLLRYVAVYRLKPVGYSSGAAEVRIYTQHLKASTGSSNEAQRLAEATGIRDSMNAMPPGTHAILCGDFNIYSTTEAAFGKFLESQADNDGRLYDPLNLSGTFNTAGYAPYHTQCPCLTCPTGSGFSGGGLDDRFDMFLPTLNMGTGQGLGLLVGTYLPVGNDGLHYNLNITDPPVIPEGAAYASALWNASDHLPVRVDLQLPAQAQIAAALPFGTVIVGATATQSLAVADVATPPADALTYSYAAPAGFTAPAGTLEAATGTPASDPIGMGTAAPGVKSGTLVVTTDDPDHPTLNVALDGTVLAHASASLDSLVALLDQTLDFGDHGAGGFATVRARIYDLGYDALQARLAVSAASITGTDAARFSIVGGFAPALVAGTPAAYDLAFDDAGAATDSTYTATLAFTSADEALPGAAAQPALTVQLRARVVGPVVVGGAGAPTATRLYPPFPNPLADGSTVRFDLALAGPVSLEVFDLSGRRVAGLLRAALTPGRYGVRWDGRAESGAALGAGLYFVRLSAPGRAAQMARIAIVR